MSVTSELCRRITETQRADLTAEAVAAAQRLVLDGLAVAVAGSQEEAITILAAHNRSQGSVGGSTILGQGFALGSVAAASLNGAAITLVTRLSTTSPPSATVTPTTHSSSA